MPARTSRTVMRVGASMVLALPPDYLRGSRIAKGDKLDVVYNDMILIKPRNKIIKDGSAEHEIRALASAMGNCTCGEGIGHSRQEEERHAERRKITD